MRPELRPLTALRFFAALAIVFHHLAGVMWIPAGSFDPYPLESAVAFFFVLSGFVLHYSYAPRIAEIGWPAFAIQRFMRLWPAHVAVILLSALWIQVPMIQFHLERQTMPEVLQILLMLQAWSRDMIVFWGLNGPSWSLSVELAFYLCFPPLMWALARAGAGPFLLGAMLFTACWLMLAGVLLLDPDNAYSALALGYIAPPARVGEFCLGMALSHGLTALLDRLRRGPVWLWSLLEIAALVLVIVAARHVVAVSHSVVRPAFGPVAGQWYESGGAVLPFALVIGTFAVGRGLLSRALSHRIPVWLGTISFSMYLLHQPLIHHWTREVVPVQPLLALQVLGFGLVLLAASALLHRYVELPGVAMGKALARWAASGARPASRLRYRASGRSAAPPVTAWPTAPGAERGADR